MRSCRRLAEVRHARLGGSVEGRMAVSSHSRDHGRGRKFPLGSCGDRPLPVFPAITMPRVAAPQKLILSYMVVVAVVIEKEPRPH
jgi:hypothetical protein